MIWSSDEENLNGYSDSGGEQPTDKEENTNPPPLLL